MITEANLEQICGGCGKEHNTKFNSTWDKTTKNAHYMIKHCEHCGYEISFRTTDGTRIK